MKRNINSVVKSKSFQMRRSNSNASSSGKRRDRSVDRGIIRSYDELHNTTAHSLPCAHLSDDSDSDCGSSTRLQEPDDTENSRYEDLTQWMGGLPNLMFASSGTPSKLFKTPVRTRSKFKPSYLLQRRKEGLAQHQPAPAVYYYLPEPASRKHSIVALLFLLMACYLLMSLASTSPTTTTATASGWLPHLLTTAADTQTTYYYLNLKESQPLLMVSKMLSLHAFAYQQHNPSQFAGVCGYPTYQQESQRQAMKVLVQMGLQDILQFDVCPPIEAVMKRDSHYVLLDEQDMPNSASAALSNPAWQATLAAQTKPTSRDPSELWRQVLTPPKAHQSSPADEPRRRLRGNLE